MAFRHKLKHKTFVFTSFSKIGFFIPLQHLWLTKLQARPARQQWRKGANIPVAG